MRNLCIIPARGGSKRIPRKNIKDFLGKPIIAYSIETALNSGLFDEVMVSTDDNEIAEIALKYGAKVPFIRSEESADDFATLSDVVEEVKAEWINSNKKFENICLLLPTAPLVSKELLQNTYTLLNNSEVDSVRPIVQFSYPIQRAFKMHSKSKVSFFNPKYATARSQDLTPAYHDAGMFYWMKWNVGLKGESKYGYEISEMECQDIDTDNDWKLAELKYKLSF
ncbi:MAG TPA: pseudaminic acid cytidylyltransferase [Bacteroidales bacterium]|nr:pseudaminic acid cytidylyltransferase [Bacteroidales bacterium]